MADKLVVNVPIGASEEEVGELLNDSSPTFVGAKKKAKDTTQTELQYTILPEQKGLFANYLMRKDSRTSYFNAVFEEGVLISIERNSVE